MLTHQIAVNAYLICQDQFLLLRRTEPASSWGPPGGRLNKNEDPIIGLQREVFEETGLRIQIVQPVTTWFGIFRKQNILSIDYLSYTHEKDVILSPEHSQYSWFSFNEIYKKRDQLFIHEFGFQFADFTRAWIANLCLKKEFSRLENVFKKREFRKYLPNRTLYPPEHIY